MVAKKGVSKHRGGTLDVVLQGLSVPALLSALQGSLWSPLGRLITFYVLLWPRILSWLRTEAAHAVAWLFQPLLGRHNRGWLPSILRHYAFIKRYQAILGTLVATGAARALARALRERFSEQERRVRALRAAMRSAVSYREWKSLARQLDAADEMRLGGRCRLQEDRMYDRTLLLQKLAHLRGVREGVSAREIMFALRADLTRNVANIAKSQIHEYSYTVPSAIREWTSEVKTQLSTLAEWPEAGISTDEKLVFFREVRHAYGRTALLLSGGGSLGSFHIGVVKALFEHRMLPRVLAGSSVGSIVASLTATRTDDELRAMFDSLEQIELSFFNNQHTVELARHFLSRGALHDASFLQAKLKRLVGSYTFLEAYERTGRILNVSVCPADTNEPARLLNYLTAPQALIWSAVAASSAFPGLFQPQDILARNARGEEVPFSSLPGAAAGGAPGVPGAAGPRGARRWRDGSLELDLPTFLLAEMFNCNHFIVSQCNPHIVPLLNLKKRLSRKWANLLELELRHRCLQAQALLSDVMPTNWLKLFTQPWEGDITIVLPSALWNVGKSISNPTTEDLLRATKLGELHVWEKLSAIEANCAVEATLDACLARLTNKARERPLSGLSARIPSWLCMGGVGQQAVASWGNPLRPSASAHWGPGGWRGSTLDLPAAADGSSAAAGSSFDAAAAATAGDGGPHPAGAEAMAAAAAAAMAGTSFRGLSYFYPSASQLGGSFSARAAGGMGGYGSFHGLPHFPPGGVMTHVGSLGAGGGVAPPPTIHEGMADERPPRVASWGSQRHLVADSVSEMQPGHGYPRGLGSAHGSAPDAAAAGDTGSVASDEVPGGFGFDEDGSAGGWAGGASGSLPSTPGGGGSSAAPDGRGGPGGGGPVDPCVLAQLDCCDTSAVVDLWGSLLPLSTAAFALELADGQGLDFIAP